MWPRVKQYLGTLLRALEEERPFALVDGLRVSNLGLAFESSGSGTQSDPAISSITHRDQDSFYSNSLTNREQDAQSLRR